MSSSLLRFESVHAEYIASVHWVLYTWGCLCWVVFHVSSICFIVQLLKSFVSVKVHSSYKQEKEVHEDPVWQLLS